MKAAMFATTLLLKSKSTPSGGGAKADDGINAG